MDTYAFAEVLEGSVRQTGIHACGIIIGKNDLEEDIPLSTNKDSELFCHPIRRQARRGCWTTKDGLPWAEKTLSIIMDAIEYARSKRGRYRY